MSENFFDRLSSLCARELVPAIRDHDGERVAAVLEGLARMLGRSIARSTGGDRNAIETMLMATENHMAVEAAAFAELIRFAEERKGEGNG